MASAFRHTHRVTYAECTVGNHVYYGRYLDLLEAARGGFFRDLGADFPYWEEHGVVFPVVECHLRYKSPARYDDILTIEVWLTAVGRVRLNFAYRVTNQSGKLVLEAETFHICAGLDEKPKRLPAELADKLAPFLDAGKITGKDKEGE
jgi:acyl-CoA thioester hydrolase